MACINLTKAMSMGNAGMEAMEVVPSRSSHLTEVCCFTGLSFAGVLEIFENDNHVLIIEICEMERYGIETYQNLTSNPMAPQIGSN